MQKTNKRKVSQESIYGLASEFTSVRQNLSTLELQKATVPQANDDASAHAVLPALSCGRSGSSAAALRIRRVNTLVLPRLQAERY